MPFGLYAVDPTDPDKVRTPRSTAGLLRRIAQAHAIPGDLLEQYPIDTSGG